jgi:HTH-type transcriptional regulator / antitoxin HipB
MSASSSNDTASLPNLGRIVRYHRKTAKLTQDNLARLAGVGTTVVREIEKGKRTVRLTTLLRVTDALSIRLEWRSPLRGAYEEEVARAEGTSPGSR